MTYADSILPEFDEEMAKTRKVLELVPDDKLDWRAHPKSNTIGWNANHLAEIPTWVVPTITQASLDFAPVGGEPYVSPALKTGKEILALFDKTVATARAALAAAKEDEMAQDWSCFWAGILLFHMPRSKVIRTFLLNHMIHHRAILCVYLRLNDVPVPEMYGPSGDA